jgi:putative ABC transport system ATP-binding protein
MPNGTKSNGVAVHCRGLKKTYGEGTTAVQALRGIDLDVRLGELMMLVGPSGSGKTTLISVIAAILNQSDGECVLFGQDLQRMSNRAKTRYRGENIGFVFQAFNLIPTLSAAENVAAPLLINGKDRPDAVRRACAVLDKEGFDERMMNSVPADLSGGQQQRVAIARAIVHDPKLVVCDEPTSSLDHETGQKIMTLLREIVLKEDRALVVVTHDARIFEFADRIAKMDDGHITSIEENSGGPK